MLKGKMISLILGILSLYLILFLFELWTLKAFAVIITVLLWYVWQTEGEENCTYLHDLIQKPWGEFVNVEHGENYKVKILKILPGESTSLQSHKHRNESWIIAQGIAIVDWGDGIGDKVITGNTVNISSGQKHRVMNDGTKTLVIVEVWYGSKLDEDDIVRHEDNYGRKD